MPERPVMKARAGEARLAEARPPEARLSEAGSSEAGVLEPGAMGESRSASDARRRADVCATSHGAREATAGQRNGDTHDARRERSQAHGDEGSPRLHVAPLLTIDR